MKKISFLSEEKYNIITTFIDNHNINEKKLAGNSFKNLVMHLGDSSPFDNSCVSVEVNRFDNSILATNSLNDSTNKQAFVNWQNYKYKKLVFFSSKRINFNAPETSLYTFLSFGRPEINLVSEEYIEVSEQFLASKDEIKILDLIIDKIEYLDLDQHYSKLLNIWENIDYIIKNNSNTINYESDEPIILILLALTHFVKFEYLKSKKLLEKSIKNLNALYNKSQEDITKEKIKFIDKILSLTSLAEPIFNSSTAENVINNEILFVFGVNNIEESEYNWQRLLLNRIYDSNLPNCRDIFRLPITNNRGGKVIANRVRIIESDFFEKIDDLINHISPSSDIIILFTHGLKNEFKKFKISLKNDSNEEYVEFSTLFNLLDDKRIENKIIILPMCYLDEEILEYNKNILIAMKGETNYAMLGSFCSAFFNAIQFTKDFMTSYNFAILMTGLFTTRADYFRLNKYNFPT